MDLGLLSRVLWRFRLIMACGFVLAFLLAVLSMFRVSTDGGFHLTHRDTETWSSQGRLMVTQEGFPQGRAALGAPDGTNVAAADQPRYLDPQRAVDLAVLYAKIANGDGVRARMFAQGRVAGSKDVMVVADKDLPTLEVLAQGTTPQAAIALARRQITALQEYLAVAQRENGVPKGDRIKIAVVTWPGRRPLLEEDATTWLSGGRSKTKPALVFVAILGLFVGLAFMLENTRPRLRALADPSAEDAAGTKPLAHSA